MMSRVGKTEGAGALHRGILEARLEKRAILPNFNVDIRDPKFLIGLRLTESNLRFRNFGFEMGFCPISQFPPAGYSSMLLPSQRRGGCATKKMPRSHRSGADGVARQLLLSCRPTPPLRRGECHGTRRGERART